MIDHAQILEFLNISNQMEVLLRLNDAGWGAEERAKFKACCIKLRRLEKLVFDYIYNEHWLLDDPDYLEVIKDD